MDYLLKIFLACGLLVGVIPVGAQGFDQKYSDQLVFSKCDFLTERTTHLVREASKAYNDRRTCFISFSLPFGLSPELKMTIFVFGHDVFNGDRLSYGNGFIQNSKGQWFFRGTEFLIDPEILETSFTEERISGETLLVGHQLIKGKVSQGGPIVLPGIRILRITPLFVVSAELNFQPLHYEKQNLGYKQLREEVSKELVNVVKSIRHMSDAADLNLKPKTTP